MILGAFKKKKTKSEGTGVEVKDLGESVEPHKLPMVFLFDFEEGVERELKELRLNYFTGSFGSTVKVENKRHEEKLLRLNHDYPSNIHEFDILMLDLTSSKLEDFNPIQHQLNKAKGSTAYALLSAYPEQVFDPRALSISLVSRDINEISDKKSIIVAFCGAENSSEYQFVEITDRGASVTGKETCSNFNFYERFPNHRARSGRKVTLPEKELKLSPLFFKHKDGISYDTVFYHPTTWKDGKNREINNFVPLLFNERKEIVSFAHFIEESVILVFPDIDDKLNFVSELFKTYLPDIVPEIFPFHGEFKWLESGDYPLPGEEVLLQKRVEIEEQYKKDIADNKNDLLEIKKQYRFLSDLISETGDTLVSAIERYLKWLDFDLVLNVDDTNPELLEEDIQVDCQDKFLVVEIKGIGGTSTDKDCAQISKIKHRRAEQRGKFDVYGLYIVNHQRYMPPKSRSNPPFTQAQIQDSNLDQRGLLTTHELFKAYFLIEEGILSKEEVRSSLFKTGLICLDPENLLSLGIPNEFYLNGCVVILNLNSLNINVGDTLIIRKQGEYSKVIIESLQVDDNSVQSCNEGEVGVKLNRSIKKNSEIFIKQV